jgi:iron complex transport system substrate-binding protein
VTDDLGRSVALPDSITRVVSLAPNITEMIYAAGGGGRLVAVSTADDYPAEVNALARLDALPVNFESIIALEPDLVLLNAEINQPDDADRLVSLGVPAIILETSSLGGVIEDITTIGQILGTSDRANPQTRLLSLAVDSLRMRTASLERPSVLFLIGFNTLYAFGRDSYIHDVIAAAGGRSITEDLDRNPVLNEEFVITEDPDYIIVAADGSFVSDYLITSHPSFAGLTAVRTGRVAGIHADLVLRPGPRIINGAYQIANIIHHELFATE